MAIEKLNQNLTLSNHNREADKTTVLSMHQASKMTGYHQDYLGQLARSGKLEAYKSGRNWFTTKYAVDKFLGRIKDEPLVVVETKIAEPKIVVSEPVMQKRDPVRELISASLIEMEKEEAAPVKVITSIPKKKISISVISTAAEAGPNVQETLGLAVAEKNAPVQFLDEESKRVFFRFSKLMERAGLNLNKNSEIKKSSIPVFDFADKKIRNFSAAKLFAWPAGAVAVLAIGFFGYSYLMNANLEDQLAALQDDAVNKQVAGESTNVFQNPNGGRASLKAGRTESKIEDLAITATSSVMVTFRNEYQGRYWVESQKDGELILKFSETPNQEIAFDYLIFESNANDLRQ